MDINHLCEHGVRQLGCEDPECKLAVWGPPMSVGANLNDGYGDVEITGYPDHYIINGDPTSCGCPEHRHLSDAVMKEFHAREAARAAAEPDKESL